MSAFVSRRVPRLAALAALVALAACAGSRRWPRLSTQRFPGPMAAGVDPLPPGREREFARGPEEVRVVRHADPVLIRPAGLSSAYPLTFYDKERRLNAGSWIYSKPGGRVETIWGDSSSIVMFGQGSGVIGSPSRGEPAFVFLEIERCTLDLRRRDQVELLGGALLTAESGPFVIERVREDVLRVRNQSRAQAEVAFRDRVFQLDPGQAIDLPLLSLGGRPFAPDPGTQRIAGAGLPIDVQGRVEVLEHPQGVRLRAGGEHEIAGQGVRVRLGEGEEVVFAGLAPAPAAAEPEPPAGDSTAPAGEAGSAAGEAGTGPDEPAVTPPASDGPEEGAGEGPPGDDPGRGRA